MKITRLQVKHVKGVREIEVQAHPTVNEIAGPNGSGKSSVLDSIVYALAGKRNIDPKALRDGEAKGEIRVELDGLVVTRRFKEGSNPTLTIKTEDGGRMGQRDLDGFWGAFTFDPLAFSRMQPAAQAGVLRQLAGEEYVQALERKDEELTKALEDRTVINRHLGSFGKLEVVKDVDEVDVAGLAKKLREAEVFNEEQRDRERSIIYASDAVAAQDEELAEAADVLDMAQERLSGAIADKTKLVADWESLPLPLAHKDTKPLHEALAAAGATNKQAEQYRKYSAQLAAQAELSRQSGDLDRIVSTIREERANLARAAELPVPDVTFTDDGVRVGGLPFEQLSSSEQIRISARIGMASSAELRVMLVKDGSLLDEASWKKLTAMAEALEYQLWVESVGEGHGDAVVLEEGAVRERL